MTESEFMRQMLDLSVFPREKFEREAAQEHGAETNGALDNSPAAPEPSDADLRKLLIGWGI